MRQNAIENAFQAAGDMHLLSRMTPLSPKAKVVSPDEPLGTVTCSGHFLPQLGISRPSHSIAFSRASAQRIRLPFALLVDWVQNNEIGSDELRSLNAPAGIPKQTARVARLMALKK